MQDPQQMPSAWLNMNSAPAVDSLTQEQKDSLLARYNPKDSAQYDPTIQPRADLSIKNSFHPPKPPMVMPEASPMPMPTPGSGEIVDRSKAMQFMGGFKHPTKIGR